MARRMGEGDGQCFFSTSAVTLFTVVSPASIRIAAATSAMSNAVRLGSRYAVATVKWYVYVYMYARVTARRPLQQVLLYCKEQ